jgi:hypothetical protein
VIASAIKDIGLIDMINACLVPAQQELLTPREAMAGMILNGRICQSALAIDPTVFGLSRPFDTAGEVSAGYAAAPSAISRANGAIRVLAREVSRNHSPSRNTFSPTAARMCPRCTRLRPM